MLTQPIGSKKQVLVKVAYTLEDFLKQVPISMAYKKNENVENFTMFLKHASSMSVQFWHSANDLHTNVTKPSGNLNAKFHLFFTLRSWSICGSRIQDFDYSLLHLTYTDNHKANLPL